MWRDDLDTAFRHLDLYDRFGCPGGQIQATFRCVVRLPETEPKATDALKVADALNARIHTCWINPSQQPPAPPATTAATPSENQHHQSLNLIGYEHRFKNSTQKNRAVSSRRRNVALN